MALNSPARAPAPAARTHPERACFVAENVDFGLAPMGDAIDPELSCNLLVAEAAGMSQTVLSLASTNIQPAVRGHFHFGEGEVYGTLSMDWYQEWFIKGCLFSPKIIDFRFGECTKTEDVSCQNEEGSVLDPSVGWIDADNNKYKTIFPAPTTTCSKIVCKSAVTSDVCTQPETYWNDRLTESSAWPAP